RMTPGRNDFVINCPRRAELFQVCKGRAYAISPYEMGLNLPQKAMFIRKLLVYPVGKRHLGGYRSRDAARRSRTCSSMELWFAWFRDSSFVPMISLLNLCFLVFRAIFIYLENIFYPPYIPRGDELF